MTHTTIEKPKDKDEFRNFIGIVLDRVDDVVPALNVTNDLRLSLEEFWEKNYAHVILMSEADSLPTDAKKSLDDYALVGCHSTRSNDLSVHTRINS